MSPSEQSTASEWFAEFIAKLEADPRRRRRLWRERVVLPARDELARAFQEKTEHLRRMLAVERMKWEDGRVSA